MFKFSQVFGVFSAITALAAADVMAATPSVSPGRAAMGAGAVAGRMPTMGISNVGNSAINGGTGSNIGGGANNPTTPTTPECPDGGVANSDYNVERCMTDVMGCISNGALPGGLNDLFNEDMRNAVINGMGLCGVQVDNCIATVRKNCAYVYRAASDVWLDFNSRRIQPEYYSFVLRKTGLTPNQAENTCGLLDKNTFGSSFNAVANGGATTAEYNNAVGAYNNGAGGLGKNNPLGATVNNGNAGVDGARGHYARWDAATGDCLVRVAAYNKGDLIKNSWLFGALGDDKPAEVWQAAGSTFTCNKDLFGFALRNQTATVAVVGTTGGAALGAGIGALAGHGDRSACENPDARAQIFELVRPGGNARAVSDYLTSAITIDQIELSQSVCNEIAGLYEKVAEAKKSGCYNGVASMAASFKQQLEHEEITNPTLVSALGALQYTNNRVSLTANIGNLAIGTTVMREGNKYYRIISESSSAAVSDGDTNGLGCPSFARAPGDTFTCNAENPGDCPLKPAEFKAEVDALETELKKLNNIFVAEEGNRGTTTLVGAGIGAGVGGLATAITAFVEKNNINCRVGDGLESVAMNKAHNIGTLKDFYVKWNLQLPDTVMPTARIVDCPTWQAACATMTDLNNCVNAQVNYQPDGASGATTLVPGACMVSGSVCIENRATAISHGACE